MFYRFRSTFELDKDEKLKFYFSNGFNPAFVIQKMNGYDILSLLFSIIENESN